jgi:hypothetical protein
MSYGTPRGRGVPASPPKIRRKRAKKDPPCGIIAVTKPYSTRRAKMPDEYETIERKILNLRRIIVRCPCCKNEIEIPSAELHEITPILGMMAHKLDQLIGDMELVKVRLDRLFPKD